MDAGWMWDAMGSKALILHPTPSDRSESAFEVVVTVIAATNSEQTRRSTPFPTSQMNPKKQTPNQLEFPFKRTSPALIKAALREYIQTHHTDTHPDAFKWDISRWDTLRKDGVGGHVHESYIQNTVA